MSNRGQMSNGLRTAAGIYTQKTSQDKERGNIERVEKTKEKERERKRRAKAEGKGKLYREREKIQSPEQKCT